MSGAHPTARGLLWILVLTLVPVPASVVSTVPLKSNTSSLPVPSNVI